MRIERRHWLGLGLAVFFAVLAWRQHALVDRYAVNVMFWDQWDFYRPLFQDKGLWGAFDQQHGPHRMGIGLVITQGLASLSGWNSRWDAFAASFVLIAAALAAVPLLRRLGAKPFFATAAVPLVFFNRHQMEDFVGASNLSHGVMPVLLLILYCWAWFVPRAAVRLALVSILNFLLIFTGFGLFAGLLTPCLVLAEWIQARRRGERDRAAYAEIALGAAVLSWALFFYDYGYWPTPPAPHFYDYILFACLMLANFFGVTGAGWVAIAVGFAVAIVLLAIGARHGWRCLRGGVAEHPDSVALFCLPAFTLVYCAVTAFGRASSGLDRAPEASRYVTLLIPAAFAIAVELSRLKTPRWAAALGAAYVAALIAGTTWFRQDEWDSLRWYSQGRQAWKKAYLETLDEAKADARANFRIYPGPVTERLDYLRRHRLNLFSGK